MVVALTDTHGRGTVSTGQDLLLPEAGWALSVCQARGLASVKPTTLTDLVVGLSIILFTSAVCPTLRSAGHSPALSEVTQGNVTFCPEGSRGEGA